MIPFSPRRSPTYTGDGVVVAFDFAFKVFTAADIAVRVSDLNGVETQLDLGADYTVLLNADQSNFPGGTVTLLAPLADEHKLVVIGALEYKQSTQLPNGGSYNAVVVERALDSLAIQVQQLLERTERTLILATTAGDGVSTSLPAPTAISVIGWDAAGTGLRNYNPGDLGVAVSYANWRTQVFNGDGVTTTFVLDDDAGNSSNIDLRINNVPQTPDVNYSYTALTRTVTILTGAPSVGTGNVVARYGQALPQGMFTLADNTVTGAKLVDNTVPTVKIADRAVTAAKMFAATTARLWGRITGSSGNVEELTGAQAQSLLPVQQARVDVASASTVNLTTGAANTDHINITGTTTINGFTVAAGRLIFVRFNAALTLTNGASLVTQTGANISTLAGDTCVLRATAANVVEVLGYTRGIPQAIGDGQTLQNVAGSRALVSPYTNSTGRAIVVYVTVNAGTASNVNVLLDGNAVLQTNVQASLPATFCFVVRPGGTYQVNASTSIAQWYELR